MEADAQHRARRHVAFARAAEAHRRAADVEERAVLQFERLGDVDAADGIALQRAARPSSPRLTPSGPTGGPSWELKTIA
jgi:hypothetical protein